MDVSPSLGRRPRPYLYRLMGVIALGLLSSCMGQDSDPGSAVFAQAPVGCAPAAIPQQFIVHWKSGHTEIYAGWDKQDLIDQVIAPNQDQIEYFEHDFRVQATPASQRISGDVGYDPIWGIAAVEAEALWNQGILGEGIKVAIIDSGTDVEHQALANQIDINSAEIPDNGIDDDGNGLIDDYYGYNFASKQASNHVENDGHGTHVAGIVAAEHGVLTSKGVAPGATLIPLDFIDSALGGSITDAMDAIDYAVTRGARVINASWGGAACSQSFREQVAALANQNVLFVAASGNDGLNIDVTQQFPASFTATSMVTVGAIGRTGLMADFSNYGVVSVDLFAPGVDILSTLPGGLEGSQPGTSMAAPYVAGAAALLWSAEPGASAQQIKQALLAGVDPHAQFSYLNATNGRLNIRRAYEALLGPALP